MYFDWQPNALPLCYTRNVQISRNFTSLRRLISKRNYYVSHCIIRGAAGVNRTPDQSLFRFGLYHHPDVSGAVRFRSDIISESTPLRDSLYTFPPWADLARDSVVKPFPEFTQLHFCITTERPEDSGECSTTELPRHVSKLYVHK